MPYYGIAAFSRGAAAWSKEELLPAFRVESLRYEVEFLSGGRQTDAQFLVGNVLNRNLFLQDERCGITVLPTGRSASRT